MFSCLIYNLSTNFKFFGRLVGQLFNSWHRRELLWDSLTTFVFYCTIPICLSIFTMVFLLQNPDQIHCAARRLCRKKNCNGWRTWIGARRHCRGLPGGWNIPRMRRKPHSIGTGSRERHRRHRKRTRKKKLCKRWRKRRNSIRPWNRSRQRHRFCQRRNLRRQSGRPSSLTPCWCTWPITSHPTAWTAWTQTISTRCPECRRQSKWTRRKTTTTTTASRFRNRPATTTNSRTDFRADFRTGYRKTCWTGFRTGWRTNSWTTGRVFRWPRLSRTVKYTAAGGAKSLMRARRAWTSTRSAAAWASGHSRGLPGRSRSRTRATLSDGHARPVRFRKLLLRHPAAGLTHFRTSSCVFVFIFFRLFCFTFLPALAFLSYAHRWLIVTGTGTSQNL